MSDQAVAVVAGLVGPTRTEKVSWRKTDLKDTFLLVRPQGTIAIGPRGGGGGGGVPNYQYLTILFTDGEGETVFQWNEQDVESEAMDEPAHELFRAVREASSGVNRAMKDWLNDIGDLQEPF